MRNCFNYVQYVACGEDVRKRTVADVASNLPEL